MVGNYTQRINIYRKLEINKKNWFNTKTGELVAFGSSQTGGCTLNIPFHSLLKHPDYKREFSRPLQVKLIFSPFFYNRKLHAVNTKIVMASCQNYFLIRNVYCHHRWESWTYLRCKQIYPIDKYLSFIYSLSRRIPKKWCMCRTLN